MFNFKKPLVSVVLASYNHVNFIEQAVKTVLDQTMPDLELLIIDDGSTDGTPDVVEKIHDKRLTLIKLKPNRRYHPRNTGIKMAKGRYIAFQNSDDVWLPDKLKKQVEFMEKNKQKGPSTELGVNSAFCFSSVFAPTDLTAPIYHRWEYYNPGTSSWEERSRLAFPISGGRSEGYRGFSIKTGLTAGEWRCDVETAGGALIGRATFTVVESSTTPTLSQKTL